MTQRQIPPSGESLIGQGGEKDSSPKALIGPTESQDVGTVMAGAEPPYTKRPFEDFVKGIGELALEEARKQIAPPVLRAEITRITNSPEGDKKTDEEKERMAIAAIVERRSQVGNPMRFPDSDPQPSDASKTAEQEPQPANTASAANGDPAKPGDSGTPETLPDPAAEKAKAEAAIKEAAEKMKALIPKWNELINNHSAGLGKYWGEHYDKELQQARIERQQRDKKVLTDEDKTEIQAEIGDKIINDFFKSIEDQLTEEEKDTLTQHNAAIDSYQKNRLKTDRSAEEILRETSANPTDIATAKGFLNKLDEVYLEKKTKRSQFTQLVEDMFSNNKKQNETAGKALEAIGGRGTTIFWIIFFLTPGGVLTAPALAAIYFGIKKYNEGMDEKNREETMRSAQPSSPDAPKPSVLPPMPQGTTGNQADRTDGTAPVISPNVAPVGNEQTGQSEAPLVAPTDGAQPEQQLEDEQKPESFVAPQEAVDEHELQQAVGALINAIGPEGKDGDNIRVASDILKGIKKRNPDVLRTNILTLPKDYIGEAANKIIEAILKEPTPQPAEESS